MFFIRFVLRRSSIDAAVLIFSGGLVGWRVGGLARHRLGWPGLEWPRCWLDGCDVGWVWVLFGFVWLVGCLVVMLDWRFVCQSMAANDHGWRPYTYVCVPSVDGCGLALRGSWP